MSSAWGRRHIASLDLKSQDKAGHNVCLKHIYKAWWSRLHTFFIRKRFARRVTPNILQKWTVFSSCPSFQLSTMADLCLHSALQATKKKKRKSGKGWLPPQACWQCAVSWLLITAMSRRRARQHSPLLLINTQTKTSQSEAPWLHQTDKVAELVGGQKRVHESAQLIVSFQSLHSYED